MLNGGTYSINNSYTPLDIGPDLKIFELNGNPGLAPLALTTAATGTADLNMDSTMIGWGQGKGSVITVSGSAVGWNWGGGSTRAQRWGTNVTLSTYFSDSNSVAFLGTAFNPTLGANVASASLGDSGSGLFQNFSGTWELAGVYDGVDGTTTTSYYADSPNETNGMDNSYAIEIEPYSAQIEADIPEPGSVALAEVGAVALIWCVRRRRKPITSARGPCRTGSGPRSYPRIFACCRS